MRPESAGSIRSHFFFWMLLASSACGPEFNGSSAERGTAPDARGAAGVGGASGHAGGTGASAGSAGLAGEGGTASDAGTLGTGGMAGSSGAAGSGEDAGSTEDAALDARPSSESGADSADAASEQTVDAPTDRSTPDGTSDAPAQADACVTTTFYLDSDGDGYGGTSASEGCQPPGIGRWVTTAGDCDDNNEVVHPGQTNFFAQGYAKTGGTGISFDYDCNGRETESGSSPKGNCQVVALNCVGSGYLVASPARSGPGVDPYCGSTLSVTCSGGALNCKAGAPFQTPPIACR